MISKISKKLLIIILILVMSMPIISYAINLPGEKQEELFLICDKKEASKGEKVTLNLNLDLIKYDSFEFTLNSNTNLENIGTEQKNVETATENNTFKIIANKLELNIAQIDIYYQIPEEIEIGTKINLTGIIKEYKNEESNNDEQVEEDAPKYDETQTEDLTQEVTITIIVIEKQEENKNQENNQNGNQNNSENQIMGNNTKNEPSANNEQQKIEATRTSKTQSTQVQTKIISSSLSGNQETNTYNGESNNYLKSLEIKNYDMNPKFAKTNTTYFIEVEGEVTGISINAEAEDENATVNIYGNDNLQEGENKILISVTAENGDVKIYRIYVTKKA